MPKIRCLICNQAFHVRPSRVAIEKFCSRECYGRYQTKVGTVKKICPICDKHFFMRKSRARQVQGASCCSQSCANELRLGQNTRPGYLKHHFDVQEAARMYVDEKWGTGKIGKQFNVSCHTIAKRLKGMGIQLRNRKEATLVHVKRGPDCHWWKGGNCKDGNGYAIVRAPNHRLANATGYVKEHHLVWEEYHGKELQRGWVVHHLNGIRDDNRPENLIALDRIPHTERENGKVAKERIRQLEAEVLNLKEQLAKLN